MRGMFKQSGTSGTAGSGGGRTATPVVEAHRDRGVYACRAIPICQNGPCSPIDYSTKFAPVPGTAEGRKAAGAGSGAAVCFYFTGIGLFGAGCTQRWLRRWAGGKKEQLPPDDHWPQILTAIQAQRKVLRVTGIGGACLPRPLVLWDILLRRGFWTDLRVGFRKRAENVEGHAWLEFEGYH